MPIQRRQASAAAVGSQDGRPHSLQSNTMLNPSKPLSTREGLKRCSTGCRGGQGRQGGVLGWVECSLVAGQGRKACLH